MQTQKETVAQVVADGVDFGEIRHTEKPSKVIPQAPEVPTPKPETSSTPPAQKTSSEYRYRQFLGESPDVAVRLAPHSGHPLVMQWKDGSHWVPLDPKGLKKHAEAFCAKMPGTYGKSVVESCASIAAPALENLEKVLENTTDRHLIGTRNHLLEILPDGQIEVLPIDRRLYVPVYLDVALDDRRIQTDPDPTKSGKDLKKFYRLRSVEELESGGLWAKLITGLLYREDERRVFQEYFGLPFTRVKAQSVAVLQGIPGSGKSQVLNILAKSIRGAVELNLSSVGRFDLAKLVGAPLVIGDEIKGRFDTVLFKRLSGHSFFNVEIKYQDPFSYQVEGPLMLGWNDPPVMTGENSSAIEQRMVVFLCDGKSHRGTKGEVVGLADRVVAEELDRVLEWALHGACRVVARGKMVPTDELPARMRSAKEAVGRASDPMRSFVEDFGIEPGDGVSVYAKDDLYDLFLGWVQKQGLQTRAPMAKNQALRHLKRVLEETHGAGCTGGDDMRVSAVHKGESRRHRVMAVSFSEPVKLMRIALPLSQQQHQIDPEKEAESTRAALELFDEENNP